MRQKVDPKSLGLHPSTVIEKTAPDRFELVIDRKSRIIMKDGRKILEKVEKIKSLYPECQVSVRTTAPVCSRTSQFLAEKDVSVVTE